MFNGDVRVVPGGVLGDKLMQLKRGSLVFKTIGEEGGWEINHSWYCCLLSPGCIVIIEESRMSGVGIVLFQRRDIEPHLLADPLPHFFLQNHWGWKSEPRPITDETEINVVQVRLPTAYCVRGDGVDYLDERRGWTHESEWGDIDLLCYLETEHFHFGGVRCNSQLPA